MIYMNNIESVIADFNSEHYVCDEDGDEIDGAVAMPALLAKHIIEVYNEAKKRMLDDSQKI